ncbi:MAG TPA: cysteine--tRNA ligase [Dehalococcoidia bacterium]|jgi:cysteinyl-tRNA synthetase|nr:cysteine--tRNA ligase [Dehalococcoidia bacterium]
MLHLHDTLTDEKRELIPLAADGVVRMYVCGVTPYSESHVGHALHAIVFDMLRRYLDWRGYRVKHVQNFTDIDDKLIERSQTLGVSMAELAERNIKDYMEHIRSMNVAAAHEYPRVTETVPAIIEFIQGLVERNLAYASGGDVYYRVRSFGSRYGALSKRNVDDLLSGARIDPTELKEDPLDFTLWKSAKPGEPAWDSPWGEGRPGWHIECSTMALNSLGEEIDIHGGGADLIFPHHSNEIAQSEGYTAKPFARFWIHNALLQLGGEKMAKSVGNIISIGEVLERYGSDALRMFAISSHYRSPVTYTPEAMEAAAAGARRLRDAATVESPAGGPPGPDGGPTRDRFTAAMDDDLNSPQAAAALFDLARDINRARDSGEDLNAARATLRELAGVLGLTLKGPAQTGADSVEPFIELLVSLRSAARAEKQWDLADRVRDGLRELGIELKDGPNSTTWEHV